MAASAYALIKREFGSPGSEDFQGNILRFVIHFSPKFMFYFMFGNHPSSINFHS